MRGTYAKRKALPGREASLVGFTDSIILLFFHPLFLSIYKEKYKNKSGPGSSTTHAAQFKPLIRVVKGVRAEKTCGKLAL